MASNNGTPNASKGRLEMIKCGAFCLQFIHFPGRSRGQLQAILQKASFCVSSQPAYATAWLAYYYAYSSLPPDGEGRTWTILLVHACSPSYAFGRQCTDTTRFVSCDAKSGVAYAGSYALLSILAQRILYLPCKQVIPLAIGSFDLRFNAATTEIGIFFSLVSTFVFV